MKSTTNVFIAVRNIGDSQDQGDCFEGSLAQSILWLAQKLSDISMAGRIVVGIGRNRDDALRGINVKSAGKAILDDDMKAMLDSVFAGNSSEDDFAGATEERVAGDDYVA